MTKRLSLALILSFITEYSIAIEEPKYTVIDAAEPFELRAYEPMIVAETLVSGDLDSASTVGFKVIAGYIFGKNTSNSNQSDKISMTAPVSMQQKEGQWLMRFVMPSIYTLDTLPTPNDQEVIIRQIPARNYAVMRFSGFTGSIKVDKKIAKLRSWMKIRGITGISEPAIARYNAPWSLPFMRRNEIIIEY